MHISIKLLISHSVSAFLLSISPPSPLLFQAFFFPSYDRLSFRLCLPTEAAHKEPASVDGKGTHCREYLFNAQPARPSILFPSISLFYLFIFFPSLSLSHSLCFSQVFPMRALQQKKNHTHLASQPGAAFWQFTNSKSALKAPVRQRVRECVKDTLLPVGGGKRSMSRTAS